MPVDTQLKNKQLSQKHNPTKRSEVDRACNLKKKLLY